MRFLFSFPSSPYRKAAVLSLVWLGLILMALLTGMTTIGRHANTYAGEFAAQCKAYLSYEDETAACIGGTYDQLETQIVERLATDSYQQGVFFFTLLVSCVPLVAFLLAFIARSSGRHRIFLIALLGSVLWMGVIPLEMALSGRTIGRYANSYDGEYAVHCYKLFVFDREKEKACLAGQLDAEDAALVRTYTRETYFGRALPLAGLFFSVPLFACAGTLLIASRRKRSFLTPLNQA